MACDLETAFLLIAGSGQTNQVVRIIKLNHEASVVHVVLRVIVVITIERVSFLQKE